MFGLKFSLSVPIVRVLKQCYVNRVITSGRTFPCRIQNRNYGLAITGNEDGSEGKTTITILNQDEKDVVLINSYSEVGFRLNAGVFTFGPIVLFPKTVLQWNINEAKDIDESSLSIFNVLDPPVDIVIVSLGEKYPEVERKISQFMLSRKINYEILPTFQACATFNFLNSEHRYIAGLFVPPEGVASPEVAILEAQIEKKTLLNTPPSSQIQD